MSTVRVILRRCSPRESESLRARKSSELVIGVLHCARVLTVSCISACLGLSFSCWQSGLCRTKSPLGWRPALKSHSSCEHASG